IISGEREVTFREINAKANRLAHFLVKSGVSIETPVAVFMHRSIDLVVATLAILKSGGVCVPLDAAHPAERLAYMIKDTRARFVITNSELRGQLPAHTAQVISF